jgi:hypothetical protein
MFIEFGRTLPYTKLVLHSAGLRTFLLQIWKRRQGSEPYTQRAEGFQTLKLMYLKMKRQVCNPLLLIGSIYLTGLLNYHQLKKIVLLQIFFSQLL